MPHDGTTEVEIPHDLLVQNYTDPVAAIVSVTYPDLMENLTNNDYFNDRAILSPTIEVVNQVTAKFLNTISSFGLPMHKLTLKVGVPIMLLRNIDEASGLCNGTRLRVTHLGKSMIEAITLNGSKPNEKVLIITWT
ncbi:uncharacterized protein LOC114720452 [Neltuma alba]|uniref:uncharacterized protein LOC114720452 n=1 Tax=Neltuma alba TaxID=207710 RepID=UPI0010A31953|nr:uncharacterized protein LOC114720452 [Prosopis alba]